MSDRDKDIAIAKAVGFKVYKGTLYAPGGTLLGGDFDIHIGKKPETPESIEATWSAYTPRFTDNESDAIWLVENSKDFAVFGLGYELEPARYWKATFLVKDAKHRVSHFTASHEDAAMAICEAWLKMNEARRGK